MKRSRFPINSSLNTELAENVRIFFVALYVTYNLLLAILLSYALYCFTAVEFGYKEIYLDSVAVEDRYSLRVMYGRNLFVLCLMVLG